MSVARKPPRSTSKAMSIEKVLAQPSMTAAELALSIRQEIFHIVPSIRRAETQMRDDRLLVNLAEVIDDLYREHSPPRDHDYLMQLIRCQLARVQALAEKPLHDEVKELRTAIAKALAKAGDVQP